MNTRYLRRKKKKDIHGFGRRGEHRNDLRDAGISYAIVSSCLRIFFSGFSKESKKNERTVDFIGDAIDLFIATSVQSFIDATSIIKSPFSQTLFPTKKKRAGFRLPIKESKRLG